MKWIQIQRIQYLSQDVLNLTWKTINLHLMKMSLINHSIVPSAEESVIPYEPNFPITTTYHFQLDLIIALSEHGLDLNVHNKFIQVIKKHSSGFNLQLLSDNLLNRIPLFKKIETNLSSSILKPKDVLVNLKGGG
jgi:hypothetical protein